MKVADTVQRATRLAENAHAGQKDKAGEPYIKHVRRVASAVAPQGILYEVTALLHDIVEDTGTTLKDLSAQGFPDAVLAAVELLTRRDYLPDYTYYGRIASNSIALAVKLADINDNTDRRRLAVLDSQVRIRLSAKYRKALLALGRPDLAEQID